MSPIAKTGTNVKPGSILPQHLPYPDPAHHGQILPDAVPAGWREPTKSGGNKIPLK
jgi:hypothetical protein